MFEEKAIYSHQFVTSEKNRKSTDVICTVIGAAFALTLFITACVIWNKDKFEKKFFNIRTSQNGSPCKEGTKVFFNDFTNATKTSCLMTCPAGYYETDGLCLPENDGKYGEFLSNPDLAGPIQYNQFKWVLFYTFIISLGLGMLWVFLTHCFPREVSILAHVGAAMALIAFGVLLLVLSDSFFSRFLWLKILVSVICFILAIILVVMVCIYANQIKFQSLFLDYSTRFLSYHPATGIYLLLYLIFMTGFVALIVWQHCCFTSQFAESRDFFNFFNTGAWEVLNILQFIWGAQFLRDSFNFCVSGCATDYYWREEEKVGFFNPYKRLLCNHWGSVVGGSFLNAFFQIPTLLAELFICHPTTCCSSMGATCYNKCNFLTCFFDLIRTDSYSYMNITGIPYCNAGRECKKICQNSKHFVGVHSPAKHYRFAAHVLLLTLALIAAWFILKARLWVHGFWNLTLIIVVIYITITFFIGLHADSAQGLQTSYLCEHELEPNHSLMQRLDAAFVADLEQWTRRQKSDGNF